MDGLSAAMTVADLSRLCYESYRLLRKYVEQVKDAHESLKDAVNQLQLNQRLFRFLQELLQEMKYSSYNDEVGWLRRPLEKQRDTLTRFEDLLKKHTLPTLEFGVWKRVKWVHETKEVEVIVGELREQEVEVKNFIELVNTYEMLD